MSILTRIPALATLVLLLGGMAVGATLFSLNDGDASKTPAEVSADVTEPKKARQIQAIQPAQRTGFSLFRTPAEGVPPSVKRMFAGSEPSTNVDLAQRADLEGLSKPLWVISGDNLICLFLERPGGGASSCGTTTRVLEKGLDLRVAQGDEGPLTITRAVRLVSDQAADQVVAVVDGGNRRIPVTDNVYLMPPDSKAVEIPNEGSK